MKQIVHRSPKIGVAARLTTGLAAVCVAVAWMLAVPAVASAFTDVPATHLNAAAINDLAARGIISGYPHGSFGPDDPVVRQQFAKMIVLSMRLPRSDADVCLFGDVEPSGGNDPLYPDHYVSVAAGRGITQGTSPTTFSPWEDITRAQVITMVTRALDYEWPGLMVQPPVGYMSTWNRAFDPVHGPNARRAEFNGLLTALPLITLDPWGAMSRAEVAQVLYNALRLVENGRPGSLWYLGADVDPEDLSAVIGLAFAGPPTVWPIIGGFGRRAGLAAMAPGGDLLLLRTTLKGDLDGPVQNLSQATGAKILGPVRPYVRHGHPSTEFSLGATGRDGHLYSFYQTGAGWGKEDISASAGGVTILGPPSPLPRPALDQYAALSPEGDLLLFKHVVLGAKWSVVNISAELGRKIAGPVRAFQTGLDPAYTDYVAAVDRSGDLLLFRSSGAKWTVINLTSQTGYKLRMWTVGSWTESTASGWSIWLTGVTNAGELIMFSSEDGGDSWQAIDLTLQTSIRAGTPAEMIRYPLATGMIHAVIAGDGSCHVATWVKAPQESWQAAVPGISRGGGPIEICGPPSVGAMDLGQQVVVPLMAWVSPD